MLRKTLGIEVGPEPLALGPRGVDGAQHLGAVVGPLNRRYAQDYGILEADSPAQAAELIAELHDADGELALVVTRAKAREPSYSISAATS